MKKERSFFVGEAPPTTGVASPKAGDASPKADVTPLFEWFMPNGKSLSALYHFSGVGTRIVSPQADA